MLRIFAVILFFITLLPVLPRPASAETDCLACHQRLKKENFVHAALDMGCISCHSTIDAKKVPHRKTGKTAKGLSAEQPELCYGCHDATLFAKKNVHAAVSMGCTGCHNPHSSKNEKLLRADVPKLCFGCHDASAFKGKVVHAPVAAGMCVSCHSPHSSDFMAVLVKNPYDLCLDCHPEIPQKQHAVTGFGSNKHPLGEQKKIRRAAAKGKKVSIKEGAEYEIKELTDPVRPDKPFYCGSCHEPHSAAAGKLFRFNSKTARDLCTHCHKM